MEVLRRILTGLIIALACAPAYAPAYAQVVALCPSGIATDARNYHVLSYVQIGAPPVALDPMYWTAGGKLTMGKAFTFKSSDTTVLRVAAGTVQAGTTTYPVVWLTGLREGMAFVRAQTGTYHTQFCVHVVAGIPGTVGDLHVVPVSGGRGSLLVWQNVKRDTLCVLAWNDPSRVCWKRGQAPVVLQAGTR
jgi:hypothetical protein